jgi:hypothetical protein
MVQDYSKPINTPDETPATETHCKHSGLRTSILDQMKAWQHRNAYRIDEYGRGLTIDLAILTNPSCEG